MTATHSTYDMLRCKLALFVLMFLVALSTSGCRKKSASPAVLPAILTAWQQGDKDAAIQRFVDADWSQRPLFDPASSMSGSEKQFEALSTSEQEAKVKDFMPRLAELRDLGKAVIQAGNDAAEKKDLAKAKKYIMAAQRFGEALNHSDHLNIIQLVGKAVKKVADDALAKLGS